MKHLKQFEIDGKWYFDESVYEVGDYAIVREEGSIWPTNTIIRCLDVARNGLPPYFERKNSKEEALQHPEYIQPLWVYNSEMIAWYLKRGCQIRNQVNTTIPQEILVQLLKFHNSKIDLSLNSNKEIRVSLLFHMGESKMYQIDNCDLKDQMYGKVEIEPIVKKIINNEYEREHTTNKTGLNNNVLCSTATIIQGHNPSGRSYSTRGRAKISI